MLSKSPSELKDEPKSAFVGFDGFVDIIYKIIRTKNDSETQYFNQIGEFGNYIVGKGHNNFSLELVEIQEKIGGNATNFTKAISNLSVSVHLLASLGFPKIHPIFKTFPKNTKLISYAEPGRALAFEFDDGKMMLYQNGILNEINWEKLKTIIGLHKIISLFESNHLLCLLNWAEIPGMTSIYMGILDEILPKINTNNKITFFDLADCSNRSPSNIIEILKIIGKYQTYTTTILSLNENEANSIFHVLFDTNKAEIQKIGEALISKLKINTILIHTKLQSIVFHPDKSFISKTDFIEKPLISTGAGDHFNAGYCAAILKDIEPENALLHANKVANLYIRTGISPNFEIIK